MNERTMYWCHLGCSGCVLMQESNGNICRTRADFYFILYRGNKFLHYKNGCGAGGMRWKSTEKMTEPFCDQRENENCDYLVSIYTEEYVLNT